jgi:hypothetical protein
VVIPIKLARRCGQFALSNGGPLLLRRCRRSLFPNLINTRDRLPAAIVWQQPLPGLQAGQCPTILSGNLAWRYTDTVVS